LKKNLKKKSLKKNFFLFLPFLKIAALNYNHKIIYKGTVDMYKKFHPLCFMVTKHEKAKDYAYMFSCLQIAVSKHFDFEYEPDTLLGELECLKDFINMHVKK
jgi:hypothetical protein